MSDLLLAYEDYLRNEKQASANTIASYMRDVVRFVSATAERGLTVQEVLASDVETYIHCLSQSGRSSSTVSRALASIKSFYDYLLRLGAVQVNPTKSVSPTRAKRKLPQILSGEEVDRFLNQPETADRKGQRDRAILELLYATGIRVSELIALNIENLNLERRTLCCVSKGRERLIPLYPKTVQVLTEYMQFTRPQLLEHQEEQALFVNMSGERMSRQGFWKLVKYYQQKAGLHKEITPHTLRHCFAAHLLENGTDIHSVQTIMGHADISSTQIYSRLLKESGKGL